MSTDREIQYRQDVSSSQLIYRFNAIQTKIPASYFIKQLIFDKRTKVIRWRKQMVLEQLDIHMQKINLDTTLHPSQK